MLSKKHRMPKALAREVFIRGSNSSLPHFLIKTSAIPAGAADKQSLFAVSISKKVASTAVLRNRTRRRVYSVLRDLLPRIKPGFYIAISIKKGGETLPYESIIAEISKASFLG